MLGGARSSGGIGLSQKDSDVTDNHKINTPAAALNWAYGIRDAYDAAISANIEQPISDLLTPIRERLDATDIAEHALLTMALRKVWGSDTRGGAVLRETIEAAVFDSRLRPASAETWATIFAWRPYAGWADPALFDPMAESTWSLPMAAAWIDAHDRVFVDVNERLWQERDRAAAHRETGREAEHVAVPESDIRRAVRECNAERRADVVRRVMRDYVKASTRWARVESDDPDDDLGFELAPRVYRGWIAPQEQSTVRARLMSALAEGKIVAERFVSGAWTAIPAGDWRFVLVRDFDDGERGVFVVLDSDGRDSVGDVRISREAIMRQWAAADGDAEPDDEAPKAERMVTNAAEMRALANSFRDGDGRLPRADDIWAELAGRGFRIDRQAFREATKDMPDRAGRGRPRKAEIPR